MEGELKEGDMEESPTAARKKHAQQVIINGCQRGLGIRVVGGRNITSDSELDFGIFIKQIIPGSLAAKDGRLQRGDQLLESNGISLMGVSNERAVEILKGCAATDSISLWVSRDSESQSDFHRLSTSLAIVQQHLVRTTPQAHPIATSTPRVAFLTPSAAATVENGYLEAETHPTDSTQTSKPEQVGLATIRESVTSDATGISTIAETDTRRSSTSSELTQISTTDISSHGDENNFENLNSNMNNAMEEVVAMPTVPLPRIGTTPSGDSGEGSSPKSLALSDVVVSLGTSTLMDTTTTSHVAPTVPNGLGSPRKPEETLSPPTAPLSPPPDDQFGDGSPPPVPTSPPPFTADELIKPQKIQPAPAEVALATADSAIAETMLRRRISPEGKSSVSPPISPRSPSLYTFSISKLAGLGIIISGGVNKPDGPQIFIDKVLDGMDAAKDGRLRKGDRILAVNGESFTNLTRERALTILTQFKLRPHVKTYTVTVERPPAPESPFGSTTSPLSLSNPPRTTTSSIFDSDTLPVSDEVPKATGLDTPEVYFHQSGRDTKPTEHSLTPHDITWLKEGGEGKVTTPSRYLVKKDTSEQDKVKYDSLHKRLSLDPNAKVKLSKLEWALSYMGYILTSQQQQKVHSSLDVDRQGKVVFAEFVKLAQEMFAFRLDDSHLEANLMYALTQKDSLEMPSIPKKATSFEQLWKEYSPLASQLKSTSSHPILPQSFSSPPLDLQQELPPLASASAGVKGEAELDHMRRQLHDLGQRQDQERLVGASSEVEKLRVEKEKALQEVARLKMLLSQKERECNELKLYHEIPPGSSGESQALRKRLGLAEAALNASKEKEHQMQDTLRCMETELAALREKQADLTSSELKRRLATLDCQLKKEQQLSRRYQVAAERLLQFAENCHEALVKSPEADRILYHPHGKGESVVRGDAVTGNPRPPQYLSRHAKLTATTLTQEAKETITAVRKLLETPTLPYGWEEAYTEDGRKYFISHETQSTSWVHPVTRIVPGMTTRSSTPTSRSRASSHSSLAAGHSNVP